MGIEVYRREEVAACDEQESWWLAEYDVYVMAIQVYETEHVDTHAPSIDEAVWEQGIVLHI